MTCCSRRSYLSMFITSRNELFLEFIWTNGNTQLPHKIRSCAQKVLKNQNVNEATVERGLLKLLLRRHIAQKVTYPLAEETLSKISENRRLCNTC